MGKHYWYRFKDSFYSLTGVLVLTFTCLLLSCCKSVEYIKVPEYHYETVVKTDTFISRDSIFYKDSVYVVQNGDTVTIDRTKYVYKDRWKEVVRVDSFVKVDSIRVPYLVEKKLTKWQQLKQDVGDVTIMFSILSIIIVLGLLILKIGIRKG